MNQNEIKKMFVESLSKFMQKAITDNSKGAYDGSKLVKLSPRGASIAIDLPHDFFRGTQINPTTIEIKFGIKK